MRKLNVNRLWLSCNGITLDDAKLVANVGAAAAVGSSVIDASIKPVRQAADMETLTLRVCAARVNFNGCHLQVDLSEVYSDSTLGTHCPACKMDGAQFTLRPICSRCGYGGLVVERCEFDSLNRSSVWHRCCLHNGPGSVSLCMTML